MKNKENRSAESGTTKKAWDAPQILELDFSETKVGKKPDGGDGDPPQFGNLKTGS